MYNTTVMDFLPIWVIFLGSTVLIVIAIEIGFALGRRKLSRVADGETPHMGGAVAATLGLLAFMLAFTFGAGTSRWDTKKELVLAESNAIGTTFLRSELLPEPHQGRIKSLLSDYVDHRLVLTHEQNFLKTAGNPDQSRELLRSKVAEAKEFQNQLWQEAVAVAGIQPTPITGLFISALNEVIDLQQRRITISVQQRMPIVFWLTLYCLAFLAMGLAGYDAGVSRSSRNLSSWVVAVAFTTVILLVVAFDRPQVSMVGQGPLVDLQQDIHKALGKD